MRYEARIQLSCPGGSEDECESGRQIRLADLESSGLCPDQGSVAAGLGLGQRFALHIARKADNLPPVAAKPVLPILAHLACVLVAGMGHAIRSSPVPFEPYVTPV